MPDLAAAPAVPSYPRYFRIAGYWVNSYKVFLCVGVYVAILMTTAVGAQRGVPPLRLGAGLLVCALVGMFGARVYHLLLHVHTYRQRRFRREIWNSERGGWGVFGALLVVPFSLAQTSMFGIPVPVFWDYMAIAIVTGGPWIRFGCICNGCCVGREHRGFFSVSQHDVHGVYRRRLPVEWLEIAWWLLGGLGLMWLWPNALPQGSYGLAVLAWYGLGRLWLEPLRQNVQTVFGRFRVNQLVAALVAVVAGGWLVLLTLRRD